MQSSSSGLFHPMIGCANAYELSALLNRTMDRFLFQDVAVRLGASLSQFPLEDIRRADLVVENWLLVGQ